MAYTEIITGEIEITCASGVDDVLFVGGIGGPVDHDLEFVIVRKRDGEIHNVFVNPEDAAKLVKTLQEWLFTKVRE